MFVFHILLMFGRVGLQQCNPRSQVVKNETYFLVVYFVRGGSSQGARRSRIRVSYLAYLSCDATGNNRVRHSISYK